MACAELFMMALMGCCTSHRPPPPALGQVWLRRRILHFRSTRMASRGWCLVTSAAVALALIHQNEANASGLTLEEDEAACVPSLCTNISDVMLVSFRKPWNEAHASFGRLLGGPLTTWHVTNQALRSYVLTSVTRRGKRPVFVAADPCEPFETMKTIRGAKHLACLPWLFVRHHSQIDTYLNSSWPPLRICDIVGILGMNTSTIQSILWPLESSIELNPSSKEMLGKLRILRRPSAKSLSGKQLSVACREGRYKKGTRTSCYSKRVRKILALLGARNVTVERRDLDKFEVISQGLHANRWNMVFDLVSLDSESVTQFDFPFIFLAHKTFYSRMGAQRAVTLSEVARESWKIAATTIFFLALVVMVTVAIGQESFWSALRGFSDMTMFLLAAVLATSAAEPNLVRRVTPLVKTVLGLWFLSILPLSVYFRSELTSIVTLRRPAYRIDTLQKLEDALDRHEVAPCVAKHTAGYYELSGRRDNAPETSLMNKLRLAFARHGDRALAAGNAFACLRCASKRDRVCYNSLEHLSRKALRKYGNVRAFVEHLRMQPTGYQMHKFLDLYKPMRRFFLATEEHKLVTWNVSERDYVEPETTNFDVSSLFVQMVILHAASCLVLLLEVLVAWCVRRASLVQGH